MLARAQWKVLSPLARRVSHDGLLAATLRSEPRRPAGALELLTSLRFGSNVLEDDKDPTANQEGVALAHRALTGRGRQIVVALDGRNHLERLDTREVLRGDEEEASVGEIRVACARKSEHALGRVGQEEVRVRGHVPSEDHEPPGAAPGVQPSTGTGPDRERRVDRLRKDLKGKKGYIAAGATFAHGLIADLRELEVEVDGVLSFHHDPVYDSNDVEQDMLAEAIQTFGDVPHYTVSISQHFQAYTSLHRSKPDFIIARHNMAALAASLGIPGAQIRFFNDGVGYDGLLRIGELIRRTLLTKKFSQSLAAHSSLPYKQWWLDQTDPFALSRKEVTPEGNSHANFSCQ